MLMQPTVLLCQKGSSMLMRVLVMTSSTSVPIIQPAFPPPEVVTGILLRKLLMLISKRACKRAHEQPAGISMPMTAVGSGNPHAADSNVQSPLTDVLLLEQALEDAVRFARSTVFTLNTAGAPAHLCSLSKHNTDIQFALSDHLPHRSMVKCFGIKMAYSK